MISLAVRRARRSLLGVSAAAAIFAGALVASPALAVSPSVPPSIVDAPEASSAAAATAIALKYQHAVVIESDTTETTQISALPDGTRQLVTNTVPVRVKQSGSWVPVDTTLKAKKTGFVVPVATTVPIEFSNGGSGPAAEIETSTGKWVTETWTYGNLPKPTLSGPSATYADILPGVDLRLTASAQGMSEVFVIEDAEAARDPRIASLALQLGGATVSAKSNGQSLALATDGSSLSSAAPTWWDSSVTGANADGPAPGSFATPLKHAVAGKSITLNTDTVTTAATAPVYPLYVDPDWSGGLLNYWYIDRGYPTTSFSNGATFRAVEKMGHASIANSSDGVEHLARDFWQMDTSGISGKHVLAAQFAVTVDYSGSCTASEFGVYQLDPSGQAVGQTWNTSPTGSWPGSPLGTDTTNMGRSGCGAAIAPIGFDVTSAAATVAANSAGSLLLGTRATSETSDTGYKELAQSASLTVTYNSIPTVTSTVVATPSRACGTATSPSALPGTSPITLQATLGDADSGASVGATFDLVNGSTLAAIASYPYSPQAVGAATVTISSLSDGFYAWKVVANDGTDSSAPSAYCYMNIVNSHPSVPSVTKTSSGTPLVGQSMTVSFTSTSADAVAVYAYWWADGSAGTPPPPPATAVNLGSTIPASGTALGPVRYVRPDTGSTNATGVTVAPIDNTSTLWVASYNAAGTISQGASGYSAGDYYVATGSDTTNVDLSSSSGGNAWSSDIMTNFYSGQIQDENTAINDPLYLGNDGWDSNSAGNLFGPPDNPMFSLPGYTALMQPTNSFSPGDFPPSTELVPLPTGYPVSYNRIAQLLSLSPAGAPTGTTTMYRCGASGTYFASVSATCEGVAGTAVPLGYLYTSATSAPSNLHLVLSPVTRCQDAAGTYGLYLASPVKFCNSGQINVSILGYAPSGLQVATPSFTNFDYTKSFTVSAWMHPSSTMSLGRSYTAISQYPYLLQQGVNATFELGVNSSGLSSLCVSTTPYGDPSGTGSDDCVTGPALAPDTWTYVTGIWDATNHQLRLLINDQITPVGTQPHSVLSGQVASSYPLLIGEGWNYNMPTSQWEGQLDDISEFQGVVSATQLDNLYNGFAPQ